VVSLSMCVFAEPNCAHSVNTESTPATVSDSSAEMDRYNLCDAVLL
jgi:hypothetical protein